VGYGIR